MCDDWDLWDGLVEMERMHWRVFVLLCLLTQLLSVVKGGKSAGLRSGERDAEF
jgi:hypothetical protein